MGYRAKGHVHAVDQQRMVTPCGLQVKPTKLQRQTAWFGTNCPQCSKFVTALRADEDARGLHDVRLKPLREQSALVIFSLEQKMTPDFVVSPGYEHAVQRWGFGDKDSVYPLLLSFARTLLKNGKWLNNTSLAISRFLVYAADHEDGRSDSAKEWSICRSFKPSGSNPHAHTYWMRLDPEGVSEPKWVYQRGSC